MAPITVDIDTFVRAESDRMLAGILQQAGGMNRFAHLREPTPLDRQTVIRMNRDTLYSFAVVDPADGATVGVPDAGSRAAGSRHGAGQARVRRRQPGAGARARAGGACSADPPRGRA